MANPMEDKILQHLRSEEYQPQLPRPMARELLLADDARYPAFHEALKQLMREGRVALGAGGSITLPAGHVGRDLIMGTYRHNRKGFGFVIPTDPEGHEDLYIPEGNNGGAITGDIVTAKIVSKSHRAGKQMFSGRVETIVQRTQKRFVGTLERHGDEWLVAPDGNMLTAVIDVADAGSRHLRAGTKVVVELTQYPEPNRRAQGVITEVLGEEGQKDVDLHTVIVQYNLPEAFPEDVLEQARQAIDATDWDQHRSARLDLSDQTIVTIDPDDAKDYDDAISLTQVKGGDWELGVHIADVANFVPVGSPLDVEANLRGNSVYFPGFVIPMLPEILSNGVCSLQEGVPRLCKSAFITIDKDGNPVRTRFANTVIHSACRLRYREAQALIDGAESIPHPGGDKRRSDYPEHVLELLKNMDMVARRIQQRRLKAGQLVLELPVVALVLDDQGRVVDAVPEDTSFTHTLIEMFMVEGNEAVARLLNEQAVAFLRRVHPGPGDAENVRLREFVTVAGYKLPKVLDRRAMQTLLDAVRGRPESYAINLAMLKSLTRAEYSPEVVGHFALASENYCHFTSPIRRYADLTIHRLLDNYLQQTAGQKSGRKRKVDWSAAPTVSDLVELGKHISFTERRGSDAERELRQVKVLSLLQGRLGDVFQGVVTGITNFGVFTQLQTWLIEGLTRYEMLMDDWWEVNASGGSVHGQRTGITLRIGDVVKVMVARVDLPRRELDLQITELPGGKQLGRGPQLRGGQAPQRKSAKTFSPRQAPSPSLPRQAPAPAPRRQAPAPVQRWQPPALSHHKQTPAPDQRRQASAPVVRGQMPTPIHHRQAPAPDQRRQVPTPVVRGQMPTPSHPMQAPAPGQRRQAPAPLAHAQTPVLLLPRQAAAPSPRRQTATPAASRKNPAPALPRKAPPIVLPKQAPAPALPKKTAKLQQPTRKFGRLGGGSTGGGKPKRHGGRR